MDYEACKPEGNRENSSPYTGSWRCIRSMLRAHLKSFAFLEEDFWKMHTRIVSSYPGSEKVQEGTARPVRRNLYFWRIALHSLARRTVKQVEAASGSEMCTVQAPLLDSSLEYERIECEVPVVRHHLVTKAQRDRIKACKSVSYNLFGHIT